MYMPEHISGTGDEISMTGIESFTRTGISSMDANGVVEAGHDHFFFQIPEEEVGSIDLGTILNRYDQYRADVDDVYDVDPARQIKIVRSQMREMALTIDHLLEENAKRDRREQFMWAGLAGFAVVALVALIRK